MDGSDGSAISSRRDATPPDSPTRAREEAVRPARPARRRAAAALLPVMAALAAAACGEPASRGEGRRAVPEPRGEAVTVTPAAYSTRVAFVPHGDGPSAYFRLDQTARPGALERSYRAWIVEGGAARRGLSVDDTVPVPRAAWRPLPVPGLRVRVGPGGRLEGVTLTGDGEPLRLAVDSALAAWTGSTGQPERLAAARAIRGADTAAGLLLERRRARPLDDPGPRERSGFLLVAGPGPAGAAVLLSLPADTASPGAGGAALPSSPAAHGLVGGRARSWGAVRVLREAGETGGGWTLELGDGPEGLRLPASGDRPPWAPSPTPSSVAGTLRAAGDARPVAGLAVTDPEP